MKKLNLLKSFFLLCALIVGSTSVWATENDTHDFAQTLSQLLNNNATISGINIAEQTYPVKKVIVSYRYNKEITNAVTVAVSVNGTSWGSKNVVGTGSDYSTLEFSGEEANGEVSISFTNNTGTGTGHGTFYVNNIQLVEGKADTRIDVATIGDLNKTDLFWGMEGTLVPAITPATGLTTNDCTVTWAEVSNDKITLLEDGTFEVGKTEEGNVDVTVTIAPTAAKEAEYKPVNKKYTLTIAKRSAVTPEGAASGGYALVTDASSLADGDKILITGTGSYKYSGDTYNYSWVMAGDNDGIRDVADVVITAGVIASAPTGAQIVELEAAPADKWYLSVGSGNYLNSGNKILTTSDSKTAFEISIVSDDATISDGTYDLQCNPNNGNGRFACYSSTQKPIQIYRQVAAASFDVTIGEAGWRSMVSAKSVTMPVGVEAYIVTGESTDKLTLTKVDRVVKNTPVLLKGAEGNHTLTVVDDDTPYAETNLLKISTETVGGNGVYVLANKGEGVGFYKWNGGLLGAGRVYVEAPAAARDFLGFDDETTGVVSVAKPQTTNTAEYYDLQGRKVAQPTKGLYIVNGKKVVIK